METLKAKTPAKLVLTRGMDRLKAMKRDTMKVVVEAVGGTLGPGGRPVLIERAEQGLPPFPTKDGVTVFRALGFRRAEQHCLMEAMRDASIRTANEAGDGTTTATILAGAFADLTEEFRAKHPKESPRRVCQEIQDLFDKVLRPEIDLAAIGVDLELEPVLDGDGNQVSAQPSPGRRAARAVACISGNGDEEMADAVMKCFDICGDEGNVTITESSGPSRYEVTKVQGYPLPTGYELSCARYAPAFINDPGTQRLVLDKPIFVMYYGRISDVQTLLPLQNKIQEAWAGEYLETHNVVLVALGFSEAVLAHLAYNFVNPSVINVYPVVVPQTPFQNGTRHFLDDLAAVVGGDVLDPLNCRIEDAQLNNLGNLRQDTDDPQQVWKVRGVTRFEASRYRSTVLGYCHQDLIKRRWSELKQLSTTDVASQLDADYLRERMAKLTGGIAKLNVVGSSNGELKERRDRAEDAVCAVRGALAHGGLIGGCRMLMRLREVLPSTPVCQEIVKPALLEPIRVLLDNAGLPEDEAAAVIARMEEEVRADSRTTFNALTMEWVDGAETGLLDSVPAVREALKNAISIATLYGTLGGIIVQARDHEFEVKDARDAAEFKRQVDEDWNPANDRA
jgi:chaperonin GroEL